MQRTAGAIVQMFIIVVVSDDISHQAHHQGHLIFKWWTVELYNCMLIDVAYTVAYTDWLTVCMCVNTCVEVLVSLANTLCDCIRIFCFPQICEMIIVEWYI